MSCYWLPDGLEWRLGLNQKKQAFPTGNTSTTHSRVILDGHDGNDMFGRRSSNICGAGIGSGSIGMSLVCEFSGIDSCTGGSGWGFWCVAMPGDVQNESNSSAGIFTSPSFTQSEPDKRGGFPCICASLKTWNVRRWYPTVVSASNSNLPIGVSLELS